MILKNAIKTKDVITSWYDFFLQTKWYLETCCFQLLESIIAITAEVLLVKSRGLNRPVVVLFSPSLSISVYSGDRLLPGTGHTDSFHGAQGWSTWEPQALGPQGQEEMGSPAMQGWRDACIPPWNSQRPTGFKSESRATFNVSQCQC